MNTLSSNQLQKYNEEGFVAPIDVFSNQEADEIKKEMGSYPGSFSGFSFDFHLDVDGPK